MLIHSQLKYTVKEHFRLSLLELTEFLSAVLNLTVIHPILVVLRGLLFHLEKEL